MDTLVHSDATAACIVMEPGGRAGGPVKEGRRQLGIGPERHIKRRKEEGGLRERQAMHPSARSWPVDPSTTLDAHDNKYSLGCKPYFPSNTTTNQAPPDADLDRRRWELCATYCHQNPSRCPSCILKLTGTLLSCGMYPECEPQLCAQYLHPFVLAVLQLSCLG